MRLHTKVTVPLIGDLKIEFTVPRDYRTCNKVIVSVVFIRVIFRFPTTCGSYKELNDPNPPANLQELHKVWEIDKLEIGICCPFHVCFIF